MNNKNSEKCCSVNIELTTSEEYWNNQYKANSTGWDLGQVSPPIKEYIDQISNKDLSILIPGCGNSYEAAYLLESGFTNVNIIDISSMLVGQLNKKFNSNPNINIIHGDFFQHQGEYDLIIEQTFFCAIEPSLRKKYVSKMNELLIKNGRIAGLLFDREFEKQGPPFGGNKSEYINLFEKAFAIKHLSPCYNSYPKRKDTELFILFNKK